MKNKSPI